MSSDKKKHTPKPVGNRKYKPVQSVDKNGVPIVRYHRVDDPEYHNDDAPLSSDKLNNNSTLGSIDQKFSDMNDDLRSYIKSCPNIYHSVTDIDVNDDHISIRYEGNNNLVIGRAEEDDNYVATLYHGNKEVYTTEGDNKKIQKVIDRAGDVFDDRKTRISVNENALNNVARGSLFGAAYKAAKGKDEAGERDRQGKVFNFINKWFRWFPGNG